MNRSPEQMTTMRQKAQATRLANKAEQEASLKILEGGAKVYRDSPPGIGFVLEFPNGRKCYYTTSSDAEFMWTKRWAKDYAEGNWGKVKEPAREPAAA